jgi:phospholipid/cholesterol/gamma-HCH transport system substrate-binding protein
MTQTENLKKSEFVIPKRSLTTEFYVGLFSVVCLIAAGWLAVGLGGIDIISSNYYLLNAEFDNVSGLKKGASVEIAGVPIGEVKDITLKDPEAIVHLKIKKNIKIQDDDIASIRTKGIIGDRYVKISRGASEMYLEPGSTVIETESVVDIEDIIGKLVHSFTGEDKETKE